MAPGMIIIFLSAIWALILIVRVESILGQKFLILSGSNIFNARGIELSNGAFFCMWLFALVGFCLGLWLIVMDSKKHTNICNDKKTNVLTDNIASDEKKCPSCAEVIKLQAKKCRFCGELLESNDTKMEIDNHALEIKAEQIGSDYILISGNSGESLCSKCKHISQTNGMYLHKPTGTYYHSNCLPDECIIAITEDNITPSRTQVCIYCGNALEEDSLFCNICGKKV